MRNKRGFTLIELLMYMGLLTILLAVLTQILITVLDAKLVSEATSAVEQDSQFILSRLMYDISRGQTITTPASLGQTSSTLQINISGINFTYALDEGDLKLTNDAGTNTINSFGTTVSDLTFQRLGKSGGKNTIKVGFTITSKTARKDRPETRTIQTTIGVR